MLNVGHEFYALLCQGSLSHGLCLCKTHLCLCRFGDGYTVTVRLTGAHPDLSPVKEFFDETFPGARLQVSLMQ